LPYIWLAWCGTVAVLDDHLVGARQLAVPAALGGEVDDDRAGRHRGHHLARDEHRRSLSGDRGRRDHDVARRDDAPEQLALPLIERLVLRGGVAALVLGARRLERQFDELRAETVDLLLHRGAHVVGLDLRAKTTRGRDGLQSRHAGPNHEHARGGDGAGGGHQHREHARDVRGGHEHGLVAGDGGHRRQHVHALRARDARQQLERERRDAPLRHGAERLAAAERILQADHDLPGPHQLEVGERRRGRAAPPHLQHDVGGAEQVGPLRDDRGALVGVFLVAEAGFEAGSGLHANVEPRFDERRDEGGNDRDAPFTGEEFSWDGNTHRSWSRRVPLYPLTSSLVAGPVAGRCGPRAGPVAWRAPNVRPCPGPARPCRVAAAVEPAAREFRQKGRPARHRGEACGRGGSR